MQLTKDEKNQNFGKQREHCHCNRKILPPYEYECTCFSCGYNVIKRKHVLSKTQRRKINFINRLKYAEQKIFCFCLEVYQINDGNVFDKI